MAADYKTETHVADQAAPKQDKGTAPREQGELLAAQSKGDRAAFAKMILQLPPPEQGSAIAAAHRMFGNRFVADALSKLRDYSHMSIEELTQLIMMECADDARADLKQMLADMNATHDERSKLRELAADDKKTATEDEASKAPQRRKP